MITMITRATITISIATSTGRTSTFQCGCSSRTLSSSSANEASCAITHILARVTCSPLRGRIPQVNRARQHWLFGIALAGAIAVRILVMLAFRPVMWFGGDSASYLATGLRLIPDPSRVGGYGFLLWLLRPLGSFAVLAAVQHLMGLAIGVMIYHLARRHRLPAWAATLAAIPVLFDAYELQLETDVVPDISFGILVFIALYLLLRSPGERRPAATAGAAFALGVSAIL